MNAPLAHPRAVDLLAQAIEYARGELDRSKPVAHRIRIFWAAVVASRGLAATDIVRDEFNQLANDVGLFADLGKPAEKTIKHVIRWGLFARNPFGKVM